MLADSWLMADLFCKCEAELAKRLEKCNAELILDGIEGIQRATRLKVSGSLLHDDLSDSCPSCTFNVAHVHFRPSASRFSAPQLTARRRSNKREINK